MKKELWIILFVILGVVMTGVIITYYYLIKRRYLKYKKRFNNFTTSK